MLCQDMVSGDIFLHADSRLELARVRKKVPAAAQAGSVQSQVRNGLARLRSLPQRSHAMHPTYFALTQRQEPCDWARWHPIPCNAVPPSHPLLALSVHPTAPLLATPALTQRREGARTSATCSMSKPPTARMTAFTRCQGATRFTRMNRATPLVT